MQNPKSTRPEIVKKEQGTVFLKSSNIVKKEPGTGSLFPNCTFETLVKYTQIENKELVPGS